jgi:hypothetical protein
MADACRGEAKLPRQSSSRQPAALSGGLIDYKIPMTLKEVAEYLRVPASKLAPYLTLRGKTRIAARKIGGKWEISPETVQDWLLRVYEEQVKRAKPQPPMGTNQTKSTMFTPHRNGKNRQRGDGA